MRLQTPSMVRSSALRSRVFDFDEHLLDWIEIG
jgi:hypothetical protein